MAAIDLLASLIREFEGCKLNAYKCPAGVWTIGYGHTKNVTEGMTITKERAVELLKEDAAVALNQALSESPILKNESPGRLAAVADFIYNLGVGNYRTSTFKKRIDAGDFAAAKESIMKWNKARVNGQLKELAGLTKRRRAEAALL